VWAHSLAADLVAYRQYGKGHTLPTFWTLCDRCEGIYASGDDDAAVEVMRTSAWSWVADEDVAECVRQPLTVFRRADLGPDRLDPEPAAVTEARRRGFVPLREVTGAAQDLGPLWPTEHALRIDGLGAISDDQDDEGDRWVVRSPWPSLSVQQTLGALWRWVERVAPARPENREADQQSLIRAFFTWTEAEVAALTDHDT